MKHEEEGICPQNKINLTHNTHTQASHNRKCVSILQNVSFKSCCKITTVSTIFLQSHYKMWKQNSICRIEQVPWILGPWATCILCCPINSLVQSQNVT